MSYLEIDDARIQILGNNTIKTIYKDRALINTLHLEKIRKAYTTLHGNDDLSELKLLIIFEGDIEFNHDVSHSYLATRYRNKTGEALVTKQKKTSEYLNAVIQLVNTKHKIQVFSNEEDALEWIKSL